MPPVGLDWTRLQIPPHGLLTDPRCSPALGQPQCGGSNAHALLVAPARALQMLPRSEDGGELGIRGMKL